MNELVDDRATIAGALDADSSALRFAVRKFGLITVGGTLRAADAVLQEHSDHLSITGRVFVATLDTGNRRRDAHLHSADFLDAARYPAIFLDVYKLPLHGFGTAIGRLRVRGTATEVELDVCVDEAAGNRCVRATGLLDRRAAGIVPPGRWDRIIGSDVHLDLTAWFRPPDAVRAAR